MKWGGERSGGAEGRWDYGGLSPPISFGPHFVPPIAPRGDYGEGLSPPHFVKKKYGGLSPPTSLHSRKGVTSLGGLSPPTIRSFFFTLLGGLWGDYGGAIAPHFIQKKEFFFISFVPHFVRPPQGCRCLAAELAAKHRAFDSSPTSFMPP